MRHIRSGKDRRAGTAQERLLRLEEVIAICGLGRSKIYQAIKLGEFPAPVKLYGRSSAWVSTEIDAWVRGVIESRNAKQPGASMSGS
jgi:prophage regulatory protein